MAGIVRRVTGAGVVALLALGVGGAEAVRAQGRWLRGPDAGFIGMGVAGVSTGELDEHLAARGFPTFGEKALAPGIGAYWRLPGGVMLGGEWNGVVLGDEEHQGRDVGVGGGYGTVGVGYAVELSPWTWAYPRLGIGGGGLGLWFDSDPEAVDFDEALADPTPAPEQESVLTRGSLVVDLGAGVELLPGGRGRGPMVGLRFGYVAAPFSSDWLLDDPRVNGTPVRGGPAASLAGPYVRVMVGIGRRR